MSSWEAREFEERRTRFQATIRELMERYRPVLDALERYDATGELRLEESVGALDLQRIVDLLAASDPTWWDDFGEYCALCKQDLTGAGRRGRGGHNESCPWLLARRIRGMNR